MGLGVYSGGVSTPSSAFVTLSVLNDFAKLSVDNDSIEDFISNPECEKVGSEYIRSKFEERIDIMGSAFQELSSRAESILEEEGETAKEEALDQIFDPSAVANELEDDVPEDFEESIEETREKAEDWSLDDIPRALFQIAKAVKRSRRKLNSELNTQFDWQSYNFSGETYDRFDEEVADEIECHTYKAIFAWASIPATWYVVTADGSNLNDIPEEVENIFSEEKSRRTEIRVVRPHQLQN